MISSMARQIRILFRALRSILVGISFAATVAILSLFSVWIYMRYSWQPRHPGLGAVAGGIYPVMLVLPIVFVAGFVWDWRHSRASGKSH